MTAQTAINDAVAAGGMSDTIISRVRSNAEGLDSAEKERVDYYIAGIRPAIAGTIVADLGSGVGGMYDGSKISMATGTIMVGSSIEQTVDMAKQVKDHEEYHEENDHTAPMQVVDATRNSVAVVIGGREFSETAFIEGLTVSQTGNEFVSTEYVQYESDFLSAINTAELSIGEVEAAVEAKDLTLIDDRTKEERPADPAYATAS